MADLKILVTGAAGYIGGSVVATLISEKTHFPKNKVFAAARTEEQVQALQPLGINVLHLNLQDEQEVAEAIFQNEIDLVIHTASSIEAQLALHLISALGKRRASSVTTGYSKEGGWPYGTIKDGDQVYKLEKELNDGFPIRVTNTAITELAQKQGVTSFIVGVPFVYGTGTGQWKKLSQNIPAIVKASMKLKTVYKFDDNSNFITVHISDLADYYVLLVKKIMQGEKLPSGEVGYYFAVAHEAGWWAMIESLTTVLHARGLVTQPTAQIWTSDDMAAETLVLPRQYVRLMHTARVTIDYKNGFPLGWQPKWNEQKFLASMDEEVSATLQYDRGRTTLFDTLKPMN
ncbi:hypothetical protein F5B22DRAFT_636918 [Xylaria bambusicola]|uniref:uncharacterized protein n=1 Tax=Xylaria bambusicola TaxID=326684 RepID=UPI0020086FB4|nr:uncharacterized protein F5B22DRAFT_636918 [Xylaria bambusicola]KAI0514845.1 hypothetical protein F5B22DRAFT_636918 [Xylaria bambusicola]